MHRWLFASGICCGLLFCLSPVAGAPGQVAAGPLYGYRVVNVFPTMPFDAVGNRLFVTGKLWPKIFEIRLERRR